MSNSTQNAPAVRPPVVGAVTTNPEEAQRFLELLSKDPAGSWFRTITSGSGANKSRRGADLKGLDAEALSRDNATSGVYVVVGEAKEATGRSNVTGMPSGCVCDHDITSCPALFVEWDDKPLKWQEIVWQELGLPRPSFQVMTGGKSIHSYWVLLEPLTPDKWRQVQQRLIDHCGSDGSVKNPSRVMRLPGFAYINMNGEVTGFTRLTNVTDTRYDLAEVLAKVEELQAATKSAGRTSERKQPTKADPAWDGLRVPLIEFVSHAHRLVLEKGSRPGANNDDGLELALDLVGVELWLKERGVEFAPSVEELFEDYVERCEGLWKDAGKNPAAFDRHAAFNRLQGAYGLEPEPSTPTSILQKRLEFHRTLARRQGRVSTEAKNLAPRRVQAGELLEAILGELGQPRLNTRTQEVLLGERTLSKDELSTLYLELSSQDTCWPKEPTFDAVMLLARQHAFDPAMQWLIAQTEGCEPLSDEDWNRLDQILLGIEDPVAAAYLPRFLVGAVARLFKPGCEVHQMPVLVGKQGIGKTRLGRALFGEDNYCSIRFSAKLDRDDITKADRHWCNEFGELDGLTSKADVEALKDFLSTSHDVIRRAYGRGEETLPRRWVGWATSNGCPLRDLTGNRRFVCIELGANPLPIETVTARRGSIWAKALQAFLEGMEWWSTPEEAKAIEAQNLEHLEIDPWSEPILKWVDSQPFVRISDVLTSALELPRAHQNNAAAARARKLLEAAGWTHHRRRRIAGRRVQAMWAPAKPSA